MNSDVPIKNGIAIPGYELEITTSRAGGPGGQHVNKTNTRITVRWNVNTTHALNDQQKERVLQKLQSYLTTTGDLVVHSGISRSQYQNKQAALARLAEMLRTALHVPKKRMATRISKAVHESRLQTKTHRSTIKKMRSKKIDNE
jgi:ribosome-associated protein